MIPEIAPGWLIGSFSEFDGLYTCDSHIDRMCLVDCKPGAEPCEVVPKKLSCDFARIESVWNNSMPPQKSSTRTKPHTLVEEIILPVFVSYEMDL